jgi:hypothetical protein
MCYKGANGTEAKDVKAHVMLAAGKDNNKKP